MIRTQELLNEWREDRRRTKSLNQVSRGQKKPGYVYFIEGGGLVKIGMSQNPRRRANEIRSTNPGARLINSVFVGSHTQAEGIEGRLHALFKDSRVEGEWFNISSAGKARIMSWWNREQLISDLPDWTAFKP